LSPLSYQQAIIAPEMASLSAPHLVQTRLVLGLSQRKLGDVLGVVKRTIQRWEDHGAIVDPSVVATLAAAVHPTDRGLAMVIASHGGTSLLELGLEKPPAPSAPPAPPPPLPTPPPPPLPPLPTSTLVDSIVCVAADAIGVLPRAIRPALAAAFVRAREVRLDVAAVADSLTGADVPAKRATDRRGSRQRGRG
jgi:DNA-binding XRE family transcriptional regulator